MQVPLLLQFSIALFTGMVAATFVPPVRKAIPRPVEILLWAAFVSVCVFSLTTINDPSARELSTSAVWGADQMINTTVGLMLGGMGSWIVDHRFPIGSWLVIVAGADIFMLMFLSSRRSAAPWQPRVRLREWVELPPLAVEPALSRQRTPAPDAVAGVNRRLAAWRSSAGTAAMAKSTEMSSWLRDEMLPRETQRFANAAAAGRVESHARVEGLRDASAHLRFALQAWFTAAVAPALKRMVTPVRLEPGEVVDIEALMDAQSASWYGGWPGQLPAARTLSPGGKDAAESHRTDRLAS